MRFTQKNDIGDYIKKSISDFKKKLKKSEIWEWGEGSFDPTKHKFIENGTRILNTRNWDYGNDLGVLEVISGGVDFRKSKIKNLGNLRIIGSTTDFRESEVKSLGNLQMIGGMVDFSDCKFDSLNKLEVIGSGVTFGKNIKDLGNLSVIGGYANFEGNKKVKSLGNLVEIYGELFLGGYKSSSSYSNIASSSITSLGQLSYIDGDVDFEGTNVENLGNLSRIEGYANFSNSKVSNLGILKYLKNYDANGVLLTKEDIKQHLRKMNTVSVIPKDLIYLSQKFLNQRKFILKIKNIDKYEKHYEEVGFNKKDLAPENKINGDWFTSTDDKNIAKQLVDDGFVEIYNEKQNNVYAIVNRTPLDLGMNRAFDITNGESGIRFTNDGMLVFYEV